MTRLSSLLVRAALAWLAIGALVGALMLAGKSVPSLATTLAWRGAHQDVLLFGWMLQLVFGVGLWILPRWPGVPRDAHAGVALSGGALLNAGVVLAAAGALSAAPAHLLLAGRLLEFSGAAVIVGLMVHRIRPYRLVAPAREAPTS
jgi:hypothetical protein